MSTAPAVKSTAARMLVSGPAPHCVPDGFTLHSAPGACLFCAVREGQHKLVHHHEIPFHKREDRPVTYDHLLASRADGERVGLGTSPTCVIKSVLVQRTERLTTWQMYRLLGYACIVHVAISGSEHAISGTDGSGDVAETRLLTFTPGSWFTKKSTVGFKMLSRCEGSVGPASMMRGCQDRQPAFLEASKSYRLMPTIVVLPIRNLKMFPPSAPAKDHNSELCSLR